MNTTCLLIDDDSEEHLLFISALQDVNASIDCVVEASGATALRMLQQDESFTPCCILLDMNLPGMDGKQCLVELRKNDRLKEVPIYMYSTSCIIYDMLQTKELGATGFIVKPRKYSELVEIVSELVNSTPPRSSYFFYKRAKEPFATYQLPTDKVASWH